jgi:hypothetical protein
MQKDTPETATEAHRLVSNANVKLDYSDSHATKRALETAHAICNEAPEVSTIVLHDGAHVKGGTLCNATIRFKHKVLESEDGRQTLERLTGALPIGNGISIVDLGITTGKFEEHFDNRMDDVVKAFADVQDELKSAAHPVGEWCIGVAVPQRSAGCRSVHRSSNEHASEGPLNTRNAHLVVGAATRNASDVFTSTLRTRHRPDDIVQCSQEATVSAWQLRNDIAACACAKLLELSPSCGIGGHTPSGSKAGFDFADTLEAMQGFVHRTNCAFSCDTGAFYGPDGTMEIRHGALGPANSSHGTSAVHVGNLHEGEIWVSSSLPRSENCASNPGSKVDFSPSDTAGGSTLFAAATSSSAALLRTMDAQEHEHDDFVERARNTMWYASSSRSHPISWQGAASHIVNPACAMCSADAARLSANVPDGGRARLFAEAFIVKNLKPSSTECSAEWAVAHTLCGNPVEVFANADTIRSVMDAHGNVLPREVAKRYGDANDTLSERDCPRFVLPAEAADCLRKHLVSKHWQALTDTARALVDDAL